MILNIEEIDITMTSSKEPKLTSKMLYHQNLDLKKKIHFKGKNGIEHQSSRKNVKSSTIYN